MSTNTRHRRAGRVSAWRLTLLLLALVAANTQQLVAQTHWHLLAVAQADAGVASPEPAAPAAPHDACLLCQIAAHAGSAAPPAATQLAVVASEVHVAHVPQHPCLVCTAQPAHAWQSRGPPTV